MIKISSIQKYLEKETGKKFRVCLNEKRDGNNQFVAIVEDNGEEIKQIILNEDEEGVADNIQIVTNGSKDLMEETNVFLWGTEVFVGEDGELQVSEEGMRNGVVVLTHFKEGTGVPTLEMIEEIKSC